MELSEIIKDQKINMATLPICIIDDPYIKNTNLTKNPIPKILLETIENRKNLINEKQVAMEQIEQLRKNKYLLELQMQDLLNDFIKKNGKLNIQGNILTEVYKSPLCERITLDPKVTIQIFI